MPCQPILPGPGSDGPVARASKAIAGFFMRLEGADAGAASQHFKHFDSIADADDEGLTEPRKILIEFGKAFTNEMPVTAGGICLPPQFRLDNVKRQDRSAWRGRGEQSVVLNPKIAFKPNDVDRYRHAPLHDLIYA